MSVDLVSYARPDEQRECFLPHLCVTHLMRIMGTAGVESQRYQVFFFPKPLHLMVPVMSRPNNYELIAAPLLCIAALASVSMLLYIFALVLHCLPGQTSKLRPPPPF